MKAYLIMRKLILAASLLFTAGCAADPSCPLHRERDAASDDAERGRVDDRIDRQVQSKITLARMMKRPARSDCPRCDKLIGRSPGSD
jgi:hypothetical protein